MPRFTVKEMLVATTLIAVGAGMIAFLFQSAEDVLRSNGQAEILAILLLWYGGGACIGAGLFKPFRSTWTGVALALMIQFALTLIPFR